MDRLGVGFSRAARGQPAARVLRDHRLRAGRAAACAGGARPQLPGANGRARVERRGRRAAGAGRGADRRRRRRRADGGLRDHGRAALRRGPVRRHLDGRRRAVAAGDARRGVAARAGRRRGAASRCSAGGCSVTGRTLRRRPRLDGRAGAEVLGRVLPRRRPRGSDRAPVRRARHAPRTRRSRRCSRRDARRVGGVQRRARLLPGAGRWSSRRSLRDEQIRARGMVAGDAAGDPGERSPRRPADYARGGPPGPRRAHRRGARARPATRRRDRGA